MAKRKKTVARKKAPAPFIKARATCEEVRRLDDDRCEVLLSLELPDGVEVDNGSSQVDVEFSAPIGMFEFCGQYEIQVRRV